MAILTGRYGAVRWDPVPASPQNPVAIIGLNAWKLSLKTDYENVAAFQDTNKVYVPGMRDVSGSLGGFWRSDSLVLVQASSQATPGYLELVPNTNEPSFVFGGLAYMDADIDCSLAVPKVSGTFMAAGPWDLP